MNPSTALATVLVDELVRGGVCDAVLCPGSRSAPLAFALAAADAQGRLRLHVRIDERSAGFLALGLAKAGRPVPVVTTSGTAVANLHPAVLEAAHSGVPLLALTCDRPPELRGTGANQTTDQVGIFGTAPVWSADFGVPEARPGQVAAWRATACRALAAALSAEHGGPAHLNLPLREPLVPDVDDTAWVEPLDGRPGGAPWTSVTSAPVSTDPIDGPARTLVLVGDLPPGPWGEAAARLATTRGWPLVAEPSNGGAWTQALPHGVLLLGDRWLDAHRPDRILAVGHLTLSRAVSGLLADPAVDLDVVSHLARWPDPAQRARSVRPLSALLGDPGPASSDREWVGEWERAAAAVATAVARALDTWPTGPAVARALLAGLPPDALLYVGSSNPVRDVHEAAAPGPVQVVASRGLAGIDGAVSTASGLALANPGVPAYALVGDLTFLHDAGGLVRGPDEPRPDLTIVVVNDDGGGIFGLLEPGEPRHSGVFERVFGTPHGVDLASLCAATRTPHVLVRSATQLAAEVGVPPAGVRVLEIRLDRTGHRDVHTRLREATRRALG